MGGAVGPQTPRGPRDEVDGPHVRCRQGWKRYGFGCNRPSERRAGLITDEQARLKVLARENRVGRRANEILPKASAYFVQAELDRRGT